MSLIIISCNNNKTEATIKKIETVDSVLVINGDDKKTLTPYEIGKFNYAEIVKNINIEKFHSIIEKTALEAKSTCKFVLTYEPKKFDILIKDDKINILHKYSAKNAMGVPSLLYIETNFSRKGEFIGTKNIEE